jgi:hypothetical protein
MHHEVDQHRLGHLHEELRAQAHFVADWARRLAGNEPPRRRDRVVRQHCEIFDDSRLVAWVLLKIPQLYQVGHTGRILLDELRHARVRADSLLKGLGKRVKVRILRRHIQEKRRKAADVQEGSLGVDQERGDVGVEFRDLRERVDCSATAIALETGRFNLRDDRLDASSHPRGHPLANDDRLLACVQGLDHGSTVDLLPECSCFQDLTALEKDPRNRRASRTHRISRGDNETRIRVCPARIDRIAALKALFALPLDEAELALYRQHTGRAAPATAPAREGWWIVGRRGGKSLIAALVAVYLATCRTYRLAAGERGTLMVIAADRRQARVVFRYIVGLLDAVPALAALVERRTRESVHFTTGVVIEVHTASFRTVRGYTIVGVVADEIAYWPAEDAANPDIEVLNAVRPGMATVPGALLLCISSPYARRGALWEAYRRNYGHDGGVLVWQAETRAMNPKVNETVIAAAYAADPTSAAAEYGARFRTDIEAYVTRETLDAAVVPGRHALPPMVDTLYVGFVDPSGGSQDAMTLAVAHVEDGRRVLDLVLERRPPFSPESTVTEFAATLAQYGVTLVAGDRYAGEWPKERFAVHNVEYVVAGRPKSDLYRDTLPLLNSGRVELLDHPRLLAQLSGLERRTGRGGRDSIDHAPGAHDDLANAACGALLLAGELAGSDPAAYEMSPEEARQAHAVWGHLEEPAAEWDEDLGLWMDEERYPRWR